MAEKDMTEKTLEAYNDVFADIANVLLFQGQKVISEKELEDAVPRSVYKADGKLHEQERDVAKYWKQGVVRIAFCGFENQTEADADMPLRVMSRWQAFKAISGLWRIILYRCARTTIMCHRRISSLMCMNCCSLCQS